MLSALSSFAIISLVKRELVVLLSFNCLLGVMWMLVFCVSSFGLQCVIVAFTGHTHLLFVFIR